MICSGLRTSGCGGLSRVSRARTRYPLVDDRRVSSGIILVTASAFGEEGPLADRVGFDALGQAMSGAVWLTGEPDQPYRAQVNCVDFGTAPHCAFGAMVPLRQRDRIGHGQQVSGSLLGTAVAMTNALSIDRALNGIERQPIGNRSYGSDPMGLFRTSYSWIVTQVVSHAIFARWADLVDEPGLIDDPLYANDMARGDKGEELSRIMAVWCVTRTTDEALTSLAEARVQVAGLVAAVEYPGTATAAPIVGAPVRSSEASRDPIACAPAAGENGAAILKEAGFSSDEIVATAAMGAVCLGAEATATHPADRP